MGLGDFTSTGGIILLTKDPGEPELEAAMTLDQYKLLPKISLSEKCLTVILARDEALVCAFCPELDLVTEMATPDEALKDMLEAMQDYAEEYLEELEIYQNGPNRSHHLPYIQAIAGCEDVWDLRMLIEIQHGRVQV